MNLYKSLLNQKAIVIGYLSQDFKSFSWYGIDFEYVGKRGSFNWYLGRI